MNLKLGLVLLGVCCDILPSVESVNLWSLGKEVLLLRDCKSGISELHEAPVGRGTFYLNDALVALIPVFLFEHTTTSIHTPSFLKLLCPCQQKPPS